jgi:hypothetical protein
MRINRKGLVPVPEILPIPQILFRSISQNVNPNPICQAPMGSPAVRFTL